MRKMVASLLPKDVNLNVRPLDDLSDEQLLMSLRVLTKQAAPLLARVAENDSEEGKPGGSGIKPPRVGPPGDPPLS
jgi:hypothetical protein